MHNDGMQSWVEQKLNISNRRVISIYRLYVLYYMNHILFTQQVKFNTNIFIRYMILPLSLTLSHKGKGKYASIFALLHSTLLPLTLPSPHRGEDKERRQLRIRKNYVLISKNYLPL